MRTGFSPSWSAFARISVAGGMLTRRGIACSSALAWMRCGRWWRMAENTAIEWCDHTFNPWIGCTKVSPACDNCYAEAMMDKRYARARWGAGQPRVRTSASNWRQPYKWNNDAALDKPRPFVFCASLADVFDNEVPDEWRRDLFYMIRETPNLVWLLLTKRIGNVRKMMDGQALPRNVAIGAT